MVIITCIVKLFRMILLTSILILLFTSEVRGDCECFQSTKYTGSSAPLNNAFDSNDFTACYSAPCEYTADSGSATSGWGTLNVQFVQPVGDPSATLQIFDGDSTNALATIFANSTDGKSTLSFKSTSTYIRIRYTQNKDAPANTYSGVIKSIDGLATTTIAPSTTIVPTTRSYNSSDFDKDPFFITHDLLVLINPTTSLGIKGLNAINTIATNFVNQLSVTVDYSSTSQTRLGLAALTPYTPNYSPLGEIWALNQADLVNGLPKSGLSLFANIDNALKNIVTTFFDDNSSDAPTRPNIQKTVLFLTADWPNDTSKASLSDDVKNTFNKYGVNLAVIGYNLGETAQGALSSGNWYNYMNLNDVGIPQIAAFTNPFFFNSRPGNVWCPDDNQVQDNSAIYEPFNYQGPCSADTDLSCDKTWNIMQFSQNGKYCNFQNRNYKFFNDLGHRLKVVVYYELENEKDYLKFFADGVEIESFTGIDVNGATFVTRAKVLEARFTTDNKGVYRGFYAQINTPF